MPDFLIRPAMLSDAAAITSILAVTGGAQLGAATPAPAPASGAPGIDRQQVFWREAIGYGEPQLLVSCDAGTVVGFVGFDRSRDKGTPSTMGEIWAIHVEPTHHGHGVGLALWDAAREGLLEEGCTDVSIWVPLSNDRAIRFHELAGFKRELATARTVTVFGARLEEIRLRRKL